MLVGRGKWVKGCDLMAISSGVWSASILLAIVLASKMLALLSASVPDESGNCDRFHLLPML
jgi:hypothetical protein